VLLITISISGRGGVPIISVIKLTAGAPGRVGTSKYGR